MTTATEIAYGKHVRFTAIVPAFSCEGRRKNQISIDVDGITVSVYDDVAQCYTTCHSLTPAQQKRLISRARRLCRQDGRCETCYGDPMLCECDPR
jgi:hypothetical protein